MRVIGDADKENVRPHTDLAASPSVRAIFLARLRANAFPQMLDTPARETLRVVHARVQKAAIPRQTLLVHETVNGPRILAHKRNLNIGLRLDVRHLTEVAIHRLTPKIQPNVGQSNGVDAGGTRKTETHASNSEISIHLVTFQLAVPAYQK
jgi:hypothetical protein